MEDDSIGTPFDKKHILEKHIVVLDKITCCVDAYGGVRKLHNQRYEEVNLGQLEQQPPQREPGMVSRNQ